MTTETRPNLGTSDVAALDDGDLANRLRDIATSGKKALIVVNGFTSCVYARRSADDAWSAEARGEFGQLCVDVASQHKSSLRWLELAGDPASTVLDSEIQTVGVTKGLLSAWFKSSEKLSHREGEVTQQIRDELRYLAAWRCQFAGCGADLRKHEATGRSGTFSYFAHIVAASKHGPRGDAELSPLLASDPENFLLLCDACHRLIDKRDPGFYSVDMLREMRRDSIATVRRALETLKYPEATPIAFLGNIAGQQAQLRHDDAMASMWASRLRSSSGAAHHFFRLGGNLHDVHQAGYWASLFQSMPQQIVMLQGLLNGTTVGGGTRPRIAVFAQHSTSVVILAGRLLGDNEASHLFQPRRDGPTGPTRWQWPDQEEITTAPLQAKLSVLKDHDNGEDEAALLVYLTADIEHPRLPAVLWRDGALQLPTLRISIETPNRDCIKRPQDLSHLGNVVDDAMQRMQDQWHVKRVHLVVVAPSTACITVGQKMQARHHASYVCYESEARPGGTFMPTIEISPRAVRELVTGIGSSAQLQL